MLAADMANSLPLSGVVIAHNEGDRIARCVGSLMSVCTEVVVLDSGSTDDTVAIARALGAKVIHQPWLGFAAQKNAAIMQATQPWVLLLDADEWLPLKAQVRLRELFASDRLGQAEVWQLLRRTHFLGCAMAFGSFSREPLERLFKPHLRYLPRHVHECLDLRGQRVARSAIRLEHDTARNADEYWEKLQRYAQLWADERHMRGKTAGYGRGTLAAFAYLFKNLVLRGGVLDGPQAWRFHGLHARYVALKYALLRGAGRT